MIDIDMTASITQLQLKASRTFIALVAVATFGIALRASLPGE